MVSKSWGAGASRSGSAAHRLKCACSPAAAIRARWGGRARPGVVEGCDRLADFLPDGECLLLRPDHIVARRGTDPAAADEVRLKLLGRGHAGEHSDPASPVPVAAARHRATEAAAVD